MPIYAYKCSSCGHAQDVLQKISDPPLAVCTACGAATFAKQLTAAGFQLKGSGWYVTDFKNGSAGRKDSGKGETKPDAGSAGSTPATQTAAPAACGSGACPACS